MHMAKLFKKFLMPCGLCAAVPAIKPSDSPQECSNGSCKRLIRPSELPLYTVEEPVPTETPRESPLPALEEQIHNVRVSFQSIIDQYQHLTDSVTSTIDTGIAHTKSSIDYLKDEDNLAPRIGAIGAGGLTGFILGIKGGKFKKLVYASVGAGLVGAIVYPKEASEAMNLATYYANIGYNFIYGVKPGNESQQKFELPELPKFPSTFSEFLDITVDLGTSAVSGLGNLAGAAYKAVTEKEEEIKTENASKKNE